MAEASQVGLVVREGVPIQEFAQTQRARRMSQVQQGFRVQLVSSLTAHSQSASNGRKGLGRTTSQAIAGYDDVG